MMDQYKSISPGPVDRETYHKLLDKYLDERPMQMDPSSTQIVQMVHCYVIWNNGVPMTRMTRHILVVKALKQEELHF